MDNRPCGDRPAGGAARHRGDRRCLWIEGQGVLGPTALTRGAVGDNGASALELGHHLAEGLRGAVGVGLGVEAEVRGAGLPAAEVDRWCVGVQGDQCHEGQQAVVTVAQVLPVIGDHHRVGRAHQRCSRAPPFQGGGAVTSSAPGCPEPRRRRRGRHAAHGQRQGGDRRWCPRGPPPQRLRLASRSSTRSRIGDRRQYDRPSPG
ncbi:hypothetical protein ACFFX0_22905 [Citricoccus parietis]|uniref:Uncharacterized protein n=1 Tax=Citricoccus parietis TaxID=592307 RepID=A0ABV5G4M5_9MICC